MLDYYTFHVPHFRVIFATPGLAAGGAECWMRTIMDHAQAVDYIAVVTMGDAGCEMARYLRCPYYTAPEKTAASVAHTMLEARNKHHGADMFVYWGLPALEGLRYCQTPVVQVMHCSGAPEEETNPWHHTWLQPIAWSSANFLAAVSDSATLAYPPNLREAEKVHVIHNGADLERTTPIYGRELQRQRWGLSSEDKVILYNGRFAESKGIPVLIQALKLLPTSWHLVIHGWGTTPEKSTLYDLCEGAVPANDKGRPRILFPKPKLDHLGDVYAAADVCALISKSEASPLSVIEAWHSGTPLVCAEYRTLFDIEREFGEQLALAYHVPRLPTPAQVAAAIERAYIDDLSIADHAQKVSRKHLTAAAMVGRWERALYTFHREWHDRNFWGAYETAEPRE